jgi:hypothetical protein
MENPMSDSAARSRLLELLPAIISKLEVYLSLGPADLKVYPLPLGFDDELRLAAGYLADVGLKPDGELLREQYHVAMETGFKLLESERWAEDPEGAAKAGYSLRWRGETERVREDRRQYIQYTAQQMLARLRRLREMVYDTGQAESLTTNPTQPMTGNTSQPPSRLSFDKETLTITLDRSSCHIDDPKAFAVYLVIAENQPQPMTKAKIGGKVAGVKGKNKIPQLLKSLPQHLRSTVRSGKNGYYIDLSPPAKRRKKSAT